jgi:tetratricopeptide (TPR) repeat protein
MSVDFFKQLSANVCFIHVLWLTPFLLALSTVFVVSGDLANGVVSGKYFWFCGSTGLMSLAACLAVFVNKINIRFSALDGLLLLFAGSVYLPALLFNETAPNTNRLTLFTLLLVFYFNCRILSGVLKSRSIYRNLLYGFIILTGLVEAVWGLRQLYGFAPSQHSLFKLTGSFFNPGPYAGYLAVVFPLALHEFIAKPNNAAVNSDNRATKHIFRIFQYVVCIPKWVSGVTCAAIILVLPAAMSRASWLAVIAGSTLVIYTHCAKKSALRTWSAKYKKIIRTISYTAIIVLLTAFAGMYLLKRDSADGRLLIWKMSLQAVAKHPLGVGLGNFASAYGDAQAAYFSKGSASETEKYVAGNPEYGFNEFLQITVESGAVAFLLFVGIIVLSVRNNIKAKKWGVLGSLVSLLVFASFSYPFSVLPFLIIFAFLLAANRRSTDNTDKTAQGKIRINRRHLCAILLALSYLLVTIFCLREQYPVYRAYKQWKTNQIYFSAGMYKQTVQYYTPLYPFLNDQIQFLFEYAQCLSKSEQPAQSNEILQRAVQISCDPMLYNIMGKNYQAMKKYAQAESCYLKSTAIVPGRIYPYYLLAKMYDEMGRTVDAQKYAGTVLTKESKTQSMAVDEMRNEMRKLIKQKSYN